MCIRAKALGLVPLLRSSTAASSAAQALPFASGRETKPGAKAHSQCLPPSSFASMQPSLCHKPVFTIAEFFGDLIKAGWFQGLVGGCGHHRGAACTSLADLGAPKPSHQLLTFMPHQEWLITYISNVEHSIRKGRLQNLDPPPPP